MRGFYTFKFLSFSTFGLQFILLFLLLFVDENSSVTVFDYRIPSEILTPLIFLTYFYPILVGIMSALYFALNYYELESNGVWIKTYLIIALVTFFSFIWSYFLLLFIVINFIEIRIPIM